MPFINSDKPVDRPEPGLHAKLPASNGRVRMFSMAMRRSGKRNPENLADRVADYLIHYIRENGLTSGQPLPSEVQVAAKLKISRGIVREAYRSLRSAGILDVSPGRVPRVGTLSNAAFVQLLGHALATRQTAPEEVLDLRNAVETRAAEIAATQRTDKHLLLLRKAVDGMRRNISDPGRFVRQDILFHEAIAAATGNPLFELVSNALRASLEASIRAGLNSPVTQSRLARVVDTHQAIVDAIEARQPARAAFLMAVHFEEAKDGIQQGKITGATDEGHASLPVG
jgi:GntR family transcriptional repressor for pyruvate dehydrogenase complex